PLAVTMASEPIWEAHLSTDRARMFFHSSSYTANPIACAAAAANLALWREEPVLDRVAALARKQGEWMAKLADFCHFSNPRQCGTIAAIDLNTDRPGYMNDLAPRLMAFFAERGVLLRPLGNTVYVMPPYCITDDQLADVWNAIGEAVISF
ncbi:aminotransferase class III-fold pyridoxal phosphate-dependent enzyme, partial [Dactylosporangium matsuzakiense]